jgi:hypothetical protein
VGSERLGTGVVRSLFAGAEIEMGMEGVGMRVRVLLQYFGRERLGIMVLVVVGEKGMVGRVCEWVNVVVVKRMLV